MKAFKNVNVYLQDVGIVKTNIGFENGKISFIGEGNLAEIIDLPDDAVVLPGFIDQHIHGSANSDAMDGRVEDLENIAKSIACEGTTAFLATTMTQSPENIQKAMVAVNNYKQNEQNYGGAKLLGIHLEGPYINKSKAGAQPAEYIVPPTVKEFEQYNQLSGNNIKLVTLAPEVENSKQFIEYLVKNDIRASIGHTSATYVQAVEACKFGASQITHTFNAQSSFTHREAGVVGAGLMTDELACEIICDTIHVSVPAIQMLIKNKPHDKVILITDAMRAKNLGDTVSELGGQTVYVKNGEARLADGTLAGSVLRMCDAVKNVVTKCGVSLTDAVDFASANPAKNLGLYDQMGGIAVGKLANFTVLSQKDYSVMLTIREGEIIYKA